MKNKYLKGLVIVLLITDSCNDKLKISQNDFYQWVKKGEVVSLSCKGYDFNKYSVYLPKNYHLQKQYPVVFFFDFHANGTLITKKLQNYAEKNGLIIVASNTLRNGLILSEIQWYLKQLYNDVKVKMRIDTTQIYALGFSGGARITNIFADEIVPVSGIILCSAGRSGTTSCIPTVHIAGSNDMNYLETRISAENLKTHSCLNCFLTFEGPHQWPPISLLERAIDILCIWNQGIDNYLRTPIGFNKFETEKKFLIERSNKVSADSLWKLTEQIKIFLSIYSNIPQTQIIKNLQDSLIRQPKIEAYYTKEEKILHYEHEQQQIIQQSIGNLPLSWWKYITDKWKFEAQSTDKLIADVSKRLLAYTSLLCYSYTFTGLQQQKWDILDHLLTLYGWVDPQNPDYHYFKAFFFMNIKNSSEALFELKEAIKLGISKEKVLNNPLFYSLHDSIPALK